MKPHPLLTALLLSSPAFAQSPLGLLVAEQSRTAFNVQGAGARAMGLGGAFIAVADDATAASFNPAGLAQLLHPEVSFVGRVVQKEVAYRDVETNARGGKVLAVGDSLVSHTRFDPQFVSALAPLRLNGRMLVFQASIQRQFSLGESTERDLDEIAVDGSAPSAQHLHQAIEQKGEIDLYSFSMAYEASARVLVGLTYNRWRGRWGLDSQSAKQGPTGNAFVNYQQWNGLAGENFNLGLLWRWPKWALGLTHRTPFHADYSFSTTVQANVNAGTGTNGQVVNLGLHWPPSTGVGFSFLPVEGWRLALDMKHTRWSQARFMSEDRAINGQNFFDLRKSSKTPNATSWNLGAERVFLRPSGVVGSLRMGLFLEPQPLRDRLTGEQRIMQGLSLGAGLNRGRFSVDAAYSYAWSSRRASQFLDLDQIVNGRVVSSIGQERTVEQRVDFSFLVRFEREPLQRALKWLFVGGPP